MVIASIMSKSSGGIVTPQDSLNSAKELFRRFEVKTYANILNPGEQHSAEVLVTKGIGEERSTSPLRISKSAICRTEMAIPRTDPAWFVSRDIKSFAFVATDVPI